MVRADSEDWLGLVWSCGFEDQCGLKVTKLRYTLEAVPLQGLASRAARSAFLPPIFIPRSRHSAHSALTPRLVLGGLSVEVLDLKREETRNVNERRQLTWHHRHVVVCRDSLGLSFRVSKRVLAPGKTGGCLLLLCTVLDSSRIPITLH